MNGNNHEFVILNEVRTNPHEAEENAYRNSLPYCEDVNQLRELFNSDAESSVRTSSDVLDHALRREFGTNRDLEYFMKLYTKLHFGQSFAMPVPPEVVCYFKVKHSAQEVTDFLRGYQRTIGTDEHGRSFLNLHDDNVREYTFIRADFDIWGNKHQLYGGYIYRTSNLRYTFFIRSSSQFDLTIIYNKL